MEFRKWKKEINLFYYGSHDVSQSTTSTNSQNYILCFSHLANIGMMLYKLWLWKYYIIIKTTFIS